MDHFSLAGLLQYQDELIFLYSFSLVGVYIHDVFANKKTRIIPFLFQMWNHLVCLLITFICFAVVPYMLLINSRFVLLLPVVLGIIGKEILTRVQTVKGFTSLLEYILGFLGIINEVDKDNLGLPTEEELEERRKQKCEEESESSDKCSNSGMQVSAQSTNSMPANPPTPVEQENTAAAHVPPVTTMAEYESFMDLDNLVHASLDNICNLIVDYYAHNDIESFLRGYHTLKVNMEFLYHKISQKQTVPVPTVLKMFEIGKKQTELDLLYNEIVQKVHEESHKKE